MMHLTEVLKADLVDRIRNLSRPMDPVPSGAAARLVPLPGLRAVLFDVYGTLFVSAAGDIGTGDDARLAAYEEAAMAAGVPLDPAFVTVLPARFREAVERVHASRRAEGVASPEIDVRHVWRVVFDALDRDGGLRGRVREEAVLRFSVEIECRTNPVWPMPGLHEALRALRARGLQLGVVSNAQFFTPLLFEALLGERIEALGLDPRLCAWSYALGEAKPSPRLLQHALLPLVDEYGVQARDTLFVGNDRLKDILPAARSRCRTALFAGDARSLRLREDDPRCAGIEPTAVVTTLAHVAEIAAG